MKHHFSHVPYHKICSALLAAVLALTIFPSVACAEAEIPGIAPGPYPTALDIVSETAVLMDGETGQVLFNKSMQRRMYPASMTKILTAMLVVERATADEIITVSQSAVDIDEWDSANIALSPGEQLTVEDALYALMLPSANDAANALAEHVAGTQAAFAELMNDTAAEIGAEYTHFANAHGLHDDDHYTTAYDMALITRRAVENRQFMRYFGASDYTMAATNLRPLERAFSNYQDMLVPDRDYYNPIVAGGKVGFTSEASHTMSTVAKKNGRTLICVVMSSPNRLDKFEDTQALLDYGFDHFRQVTVDQESFQLNGVPVGDEGTVDFYSESDFTAWLRDDLTTDRIRVQFDFPEVLKPDHPLPTAAKVVIDPLDDTLPALLGSQILSADITLNAPAVPVELARRETMPAMEAAALHLYAVLALIGVVLLLLAILLLRYHSQQKRRRQRMDRLNRRIRANYQAR